MNSIVVFQKELQRCFSSPWAWLVAGLFWLVTGFYVAEILLGAESAIAEWSTQQESLTAAIDIPRLLFEDIFSTVGSLCWWILALLSLGLNQHDKYMQLESDPYSKIASSYFVWGVLLSRVAFFLFMLVPLVIIEAIVFSSVEPQIGILVTLTAHGALVLLAGVIVSWQMAIAACLRSRWLFAMATSALFALFWLLGIFGFPSQGTGFSLLGHFSVFAGYSNLVRGIFVLSDLVVMFSYILIGVFFTSQITKLSFLSRS